MRASGEPTQAAARAGALAVVATAVLLTGPAVAAAPEPVALPALEVLASRVADEPGEGTIAAWSRDELVEAAPRTLDEVLATEPSFSLYRRQSAVFGNPTSSGVSLRNTGATAASRTLVVLDGIPQNDPFGGWVSWARYDAATLDSLRIVGPSRAVVWGNQSPAGMVQLTSRDPWETGHALRASGGSQGSAGASAWSRQVDPEKRAAVAAGGYFFETDGFRAVAPWQRGPIDERLDTTVAGGTLGGAWRPADGLTLEPLASYHYEDRGNGTPLSRNSTSAADFSLRLTAERAGGSWQVIAYHQERDFESVFTSVNADRTAETLALDQYDVPASGTGGAWIVRGEWTDALTLTGGADVRFLTGETREIVGTFRHRVAGGRQATQGLFGALAWQPCADTAIEAGVRADWWQLTDGIRSESLLASGASVRDERQPDRDSWEPSASVEIRHDLVEKLTAYASAGSSFRLPTLNELHRPFRVRNDIVEANPALDPERFYSISGGLEWRPAPEWEWRVEAFHHWIDDAIANVPVTDPTQIAGIIGTLPAGGTLAQRQNVDRATVAGVEAGALWRPRDDFSLDLRALWSDTRFQRSSAQPLLEDMPFPQAPDWRLSALGEWRATDRVTLFAGVEAASGQFDDALATRRLDAYASVRAGLRWRAGPVSCQVRLDNLLDQNIQTGVSGDGIITQAAPRSLWVSLDWEF